MDVQLHVLPLAEPCELVTARKHREGESEGPLGRPLRCMAGQKGSRCGQDPHVRTETPGQSWA